MKWFERSKSLKGKIEMEINFTLLKERERERNDLKKGKVIWVQNSDVDHWQIFALFSSFKQNKVCCY